MTKIFENCKCEWNRDYISVYDLEDNLLGTIQGTDPSEDWSLIESGHNPINERWEDGAGNTVSLKGWN